MRRVVRPGGLLCIIEHNPFNPLTRLAVVRCEFDRDAVLLPALAPRAPIAAAAAGSRISGSSAATSASTSPGGVSTPVTPSSTTSSAAPARDATSAAPTDIASIRVNPKPSLREVKA